MEILARIKAHGRICPMCGRTIPWAPEPTDLEMRFPALCAHVMYALFANRPCKMYTRTFTEGEKLLNLRNMDLG